MHIVDLGVLREQIVVGVFLKVLERVAGAGQQHGACFGKVELVERYLEGARLDRRGDVETERACREEAALLPVPEQHLPVGRAAEGDDDFFLAGAERAANHFLRFEPVALVRSVGQPLPFLRTDDFINRDEPFFALHVAFADGDVLAVLRAVNARDGFCALGAYI